MHKSKHLLKVISSVILLSMAATACYPAIISTQGPEGTPTVQITPTGFIRIIPLTGKESPAAEESVPPEPSTTSEIPTGEAVEITATAEETATEAVPPEATATPIPSETALVTETSVVVPTETPLATPSEVPAEEAGAETSQETMQDDFHPLLGETTSTGEQPELSGATSNLSTMSWTGDLETGDISQWQAYGDFLTQGSASTYSIVSSPVHGGQKAVALTINTAAPTDSGNHSAYLFLWNQDLLAGDNYYSAWYYIPSNIDVQTWWAIMQWKSTSDGDSSHSVAAFQILVRDTGSTKELFVAQRTTPRDDIDSNIVNYYQSVRKIPLDTWFRIKVYYKRGINDGQIIVWQDDAQLFNLTNKQTVYADNTVYWSIHNYTDNILPHPETIYIDDAHLDRSDPDTTLPPAKLTGISPSGTYTTTNKMTYSWNAASGATAYQLLVNGPSGAVENVVYSPTDVGCSSGSGTCSKTIDTALANGSYSWMVRAQNAAGWGEYSNVLPFTISLSLPAKVTTVSPTGNISTNTVTYTWNAISGAIGYNISVEGPSGNVLNSYNIPSQVGCSTGSGTCSLYVSSALPNASYTWSVRAQNSAGWGPFSNATSFVVNNLPPPPAPVSPTGTVAVSKVTYTWNAISGAIGYNVYAEGPSGLVFNSYNVPSQLGCSTGTGTCSLYIDNALTNATYTWYVRAQNANGWGSFSSGTNFVINLPVPAAPVPVSPSGTIVGTNKVAYTWNAISSAVGYHVYAETLSGSIVANSYNVPSQLGCSAGSGTCSLSVSSALDDAAYNWYVRAQNSIGWGTFSNATAFTINIKPPAPTSVSPSGTITSTNKMTYTWNAISGAIGYNVYAEGPSGLVLNSYNIPSQLGCTTGTGTCSLYIDSALTNATYTWYVRAQNSGGWGPFSSGTAFAVSLAVPPAPTTVSPRGTITSTNKMTYTWNAISGAVGYNVYAEGSSGIVFNSYNVPSQLGCSAGTGTCSLYIDNALANASYTWYVRAQNSIDWGPFSGGTAFVLNLPVPSAPAPVSPAGTINGTNKVAYTWNAISSAVGYHVYAETLSGSIVANSYNIPSQLGCSAGSGNCTIYVNSALDDATYNWYVRAQNSVGWGTFSNATAFTIDIKPPAPTLVSPSGTITSTNKMTYTWNAISGAIGYHVYAEGPSGNIVVSSYNIPSQLGCTSGTGTCALYVDSALTNATYTWYVRAQNSGGWGPFSSATNFVVNLAVPSAPTTVSPRGTITDSNKMTYTWNAINGAVGYNVYAEGPSGLILNSYNIPSQLGCATGSGTCSLTVENALTNASYSWYVRAQNNIGWGPFSSATNFIINLPVPPAPTPVAPSGTITGTNKVTYTWNAVSGAIGYNIYAEGPSGNIVANSYNIPSQVGCSTGSGTCSLYIDSALASATYNWYVRAQNNAGWGSFSSGTAFTIR